MQRACFYESHSFLFVPCGSKGSAGYFNLSFGFGVVLSSGLAASGNPG